MRDENYSLIVRSVILILVMAGMFAFGIHLLYSISDSIDLNEIHDQFITNQTFVNEFDCNDLKVLHSSIDGLWLKPKEEIATVKQDLINVQIEKRCEVSDIGK